MADEISPSDARNGHTYSTYAEIEDYEARGLKPQPNTINRRSIGSSVRELPATPDEAPYNASYYEIEDKDHSVDDKSKKQKKIDIPKKYSSIANNRFKIYDNKHNADVKRKTISSPYNIYADIYDDGEKRDADKAYIDMSQKQSDKDANKGVKDKFNQTKRTQAIPNTQNLGSKNNTKANLSRISQASKKESLTSADSDSDDELYIVDNELYEPFESAKV